MFTFILFYPTYSEIITKLLFLFGWPSNGIKEKRNKTRFLFSELAEINVFMGMDSTPVACYLRLKSNEVNTYVKVNGC